MPRRMVRSQIRKRVVRALGSLFEFTQMNGLFAYSSCDLYVLRLSDSPPCGRPTGQKGQQLQGPYRQDFPDLASTPAVGVDSSNRTSVYWKGTLGPSSPQAARLDQYACIQPDLQRSLST